MHPVSAGRGAVGTVAAPPCQAAHESDWKPWQAEARPVPASRLPLAWLIPRQECAAAAWLPANSTAGPGTGRDATTCPESLAMANWLAVGRVVWGWHCADPGSAVPCSATAVPRGQDRRAPAPQLCRSLPMLCRAHSPVAPQHGHGAGAGEEGWLPDGWLCPALPVPGAACSPPRSLGGGGIFSWLAPACQLEYKGIIFL